MSVSKFQELNSSNTANLGQTSDEATGQRQSRPLDASASFLTSLNDSQLSSYSATSSASTSYTSPPFSVSSAVSSITTTSLLPSPVPTSIMDGLKRKYSRPASLRSFSSTTQVTTVVTAAGSTASSPSTSQFPSSSTAFTSGPMPIPTPRRSQQGNPLNYRATNTTMPVVTSASSWSLSQSRNKLGYVTAESTRNSYDPDRRLSVVINVYDILQDSRFAPFIWILGIGVYHSAVEIDGREYAYGGHEEPGISGVYYSKSKTPLPGGIICKTSILHGYTSYSPAEVHAIISDLSSEYMGTSYHLLYKNCNHFTNSLLLRLTDRPAPAWLNRATFIGSALPCIIPQTYIKPPKCDVPVCASSESLSSSLTQNEKSYDEMTAAPMAVKEPWSWYKGSTRSQSPSVSLPVKKITDMGQSKKSCEESSHDQDAFESEPFLISTRYIENEVVASDSGSGSGSDSGGEGAEGDGSVAVDEKAKQNRDAKSSYTNTSKSKRTSHVIYEKTSIRTYNALAQSPPISFGPSMQDIH
ncbi:PPPDE putative peptidase domain-containing protein [Lipomyces starkeyi]